jgi:hypothetical protein
VAAAVNDHEPPRWAVSMVNPDRFPNRHVATTTRVPRLIVMFD